MSSWAKRKMRLAGDDPTDVARYSLQATREMVRKEEEQAKGIPLTRRRIGRR